MQIFSYTLYQQAESIRWLFDISCDVRSSLGSTTQASCASSASCQPEVGNSWCSRQPRRARTVPIGLISWQRFLQCFNALLQAPSLASRPGDAGSTQELNALPSPVSRPEILPQQAAFVHQWPFSPVPCSSEGVTPRG